MSEKHTEEPSEAQAVPETDRPDQRRRNIAYRRACDEAGIPTRVLEDGAVAELIEASTAALLHMDEGAWVTTPKYPRVPPAKRLEAALAELKGAPGE